MGDAAPETRAAVPEGQGMPGQPTQFSDRDMYLQKPKSEADSGVRHG
jgi:hypothetical protein